MNQAILERAIQKAIDGGWKDGKYELRLLDSITVRSKDDAEIDTPLTAIGNYIWSKRIYPSIIFNHDFAKSLFGERIVDDGKQYNRLVHRLLAKTYIPNPLNCPQVNHKDGDRANNKLSNLEWCTASENVQDGFNRGRQAWNRDMKSTASMNLEDLARELPRLQELAKALWGDGTDHSETFGLYKPDGWKHHIQQMVIADDPIKYLKDNI